MARPLLLRTRWLAGHVVIAALVALMLWLGFWQLDRLQERKHRNVETRAGMAAAPLTVIPPPGTESYRSVELSGLWDAAGTRLVRYPIRNGLQGYDVVTPLVTPSGDRVAVKRGWIPIETGKTLPAAASAPTGLVTVKAWYRHADRPSPKTGRNEADPPLETVMALDTPYLQIRPGEVTGGVRSGEQVVMPLPLEGPDLTEGPHFGYALQWFSFCLIAIGGWAALLWRASRDEKAE